MVSERNTSIYKKTDDTRDSLSCWKNRGKDREKDSGGNSSSETIEYKSLKKDKEKKVHIMEAKKIKDLSLS